MNVRLTWLRSAAAICTAGAALIATPAHAGLFDDNEARQAVLDLRAKNSALTDQLSAAQRTILNQSNQLDQLNQQVATLRGQIEDLANHVATLQKQQRDYYTDLDVRLKKFEPQQQTVDGIQGEVQPGEADIFNGALQRFKNGDFKAAVAAFRSFISKYPQSPYQPSARYWLGNALYAQRDYKGSTAILQGVVTKYPAHPRAPDALLAIANNQLEQGQKKTAKKTLERVTTQYSDSNAAQAAQNRLSQIR